MVESQGSQLIGEQLCERIGGSCWITAFSPEVGQVVTRRKHVRMIRPKDPQPILEQLRERLGRTC